MAEVRYINVTKSFGQVKAVNDFTLNIPDGEFIVLVGPSGCGKSTAMRLLAGLEEVTRGEIYIGDRMVNDVHPRDRDVAMVFQSYALYPQMTVYRNLSFCLEMRKVSKEQIDETVRRTADLLALGGLLDRKPSQLSGGQRQRVALGRAIVRDPRVFLFDEPLSNLDAKLRITMRAELLDLHQRLQTTTIYVTHDQLEAMTMGSRIVVMRQGIIQQVDAPTTVYNHPVNMFVAGFIGSPSMNFIDCKLIREEGAILAVNSWFKLRLPEDKWPLAEHYIDRPVILGLRPEHFSHLIDSDEALPETEMSAKVWVVEPVGFEKLVHIRHQDNTIVIRLPATSELKPGETGRFGVRMESAHLFDPDNEVTIF